MMTVRWSCQLCLPDLLTPHFFYFYGGRAIATKIDMMAEHKYAQDF